MPIWVYTDGPFQPRTMEGSAIDELLSSVGDTLVDRI
jgi:hypothetical protein